MSDDAGLEQMVECAGESDSAATLPASPLPCWHNTGSRPLPPFFCAQVHIPQPLWIPHHMRFIELGRLLMKHSWWLTTRRSPSPVRLPPSSRMDASARKLGDGQRRGELRRDDHERWGWRPAARRDMSDASTGSAGHLQAEET